ncbi:hypothetical protein BCR33DRAFT_791373 [Rhizoclosmatium globosum]|uniref:Uncharacterized protein n=1 Tax=Rhizoclosmatium globosum TaxID=329046 RepID=A0A1Y2BFH8_9FUNG|nr:hypothetical protein BCR33DRAFT_791373 [Rhizoclosmatium globosum]|eukprot:ORY33569.1 hypothetical protein BCR33DRAFT_791373 [Rhizoclosmatium globosum]
MPWETRAVFAFFAQLYCIIDLCYTMGTLALYTLLLTTYTPDRVLETWDSRKEVREWRNPGATMAVFGVSGVLH